MFYEWDILRIKKKIDHQKHPKQFVESEPRLFDTIMKWAVRILIAALIVGFFTRGH